MPAAARLILICCMFFLAACQEDAPVTTDGDRTLSSLVTEAQSDCNREGGTWGKRGNALYTCYLPTSDANEFCSAATDCESLCLARSRTCAPITPFLGCHEVLTDSGTRATQCVN